MRVRWVYSDADERAHVLNENGPAGSGTVVTRCRQVLPDTVLVYQMVPSMNVCPHCGCYAAVPPPEHGTRTESMSAEFPAGTTKNRPDVGIP